MKRSLYEEMFRQEKTLWWHVGKRELAKGFILAGGRRDKYLDVGCGTGAMLLEMKSYFGEVDGLDGSEEALNFCRRRRLNGVAKADLEKRLPFPAESFDAVTALDVIEHVRNDSGLVREMFRVLRLGGRLVVTVPAYRWLWTYWDEILGHKRRYSAGELQRLLVEGGFRVVRVSYFNSFLMAAVPVRLVKNLFGSRTSDFLDLPGPISAFLLFAARVERMIIKMVNLPFGTSILILADKADES